jgi:hypothetical protein
LLLLTGRLGMVDDPSKMLELAHRNNGAAQSAACSAVHLKEAPNRPTPRTHSHRRNDVLLSVQVLEQLYAVDMAVTS